MPVTGLDQVVGSLKLQMNKAKGELTNKAITEMLIIGAENAANITPRDTSTLINSQGRQLWATATGQAGAVYYGAKYAKWVHNMPGTLRGKPRAHFGVTGNQSEFGPRQKVQFGGGSLKGFYWDTTHGNSDAQPKFLEIGMEEMAKDAGAILKKYYAVD